jgi:hypothetical protein
MILGSRLSVAEWDAMISKEQLYARFEGNPSQFRDPQMALFFTDDKAKAVAEYLKKTAETLRPVMLDIISHNTDLPEPRKNEAENIIGDLNLDDTESMSTLAYIIYDALDSTNEDSFVCRIMNGNGVPEARAEARAFARYLKFKAADDARMEAFRRTAEYRMQEAEVKLCLRDHIELPEE